jgi:hypothetical protein
VQVPRVKDTYEIHLESGSTKRCKGYWSFRRWHRNNDTDLVVAVYYEGIKQNHKEFFAWLNNHYTE